MVQFTGALSLVFWKMMLIWKDNKGGGGTSANFGKGCAAKVCEP